jgi:hypothetical protein
MKTRAGRTFIFVTVNMIRDMKVQLADDVYNLRTYKPWLVPRIPYMRTFSYFRCETKLH